MKALIPKELKLGIRFFVNLGKEMTNGYLFSFAKKRNDFFKFTNQLQLTQSLRPNQAKVHNLRIAIKSIESITILPNEIFSFWKIVGKPSLKNGFKESRSILANKIEPTVGGGLCQLSGLVYYLSITANLEIIERHHHSIDIYTDETRFTPLGSDAAVAYGYKDLKIRNNSNGAIQFSFQIKEKEITIKLHHYGILKYQKVDFKKRLLLDNKIEVETMINNQIITNSVYLKLT